MSRSIVGLSALAFALVFGLHFGLSTWQQEHVAAQWVRIGSGHAEPTWKQYFERGDHWLGYSYALAAAFTAFAAGLMVRRQRRAARGVLGGVTLLGVLYGAGCFLIGCCGSPMLAVYLSVFGASILGLLKPLVALITTVSVAASAIVVLRRSNSSSCVACEPAIQSSPRSESMDAR